MTVKVKNTVLDRTKIRLHRTAPRLEMEPFFQGRRVRIGETIDVADEDYINNKEFFDKWVSFGVFEVETSLGIEKNNSDRRDLFNAEGLRLDGPTFEQWVEASYPPEAYPPKEYAEKPSEGLRAYRESLAKSRDLVLPVEEIPAPVDAPPPAPVLPPVSTVEIPPVVESPKVGIPPVKVPEIDSISDTKKGNKKSSSERR